MTERTAENGTPRWGVCIQVGHNYAAHEETDHCLSFTPQARHDHRARFCRERRPGEWVTGIRCLACDPVPRDMPPGENRP